MRKYRNYTDDQVKEAIKDSISWRETASKVGLSKDSGSAYTTLQKIAKNNNYDYSHFQGQSYLKGKTHNWSKLIPLEEILVENSSYSRRYLKIRLLKEGFLENKCYNCGLTEWLGKPISIQLEHKNGVNNDNRLENLTLLCPNCHSQTLTYCGRNKKTVKKECLCKKCNKKISKGSKSGLCIKCVKINRSTITYYRKVENRPSKKQLLKEVKETSYCAVGRKYGVSDNAIRKWIK